MNFLPWHKSESEKEKIINAELRQRRREIVEVMKENAKLRSRIEELESKHIFSQIVAQLRSEAANHVVEPYDDVAIGYIGGLERAADLLDGDQANNNNMEDN
jgi:hypothetical protein